MIIKACTKTVLGMLAYGLCFLGMCYLLSANKVPLIPSFFIVLFFVLSGIICSWETE